MNRWYDKDQTLSELIESLKFVSEEQVEKIMVKVKKLIDAENADLVDLHLDNFPMRRRWYDHNPYTWLVINTLQYASPQLLEKVKICLSKNIPKITLQ